MDKPMQTEDFCDLELEDGTILTAEERQRSADKVGEIVIETFQEFDRKGDVIGISVDKFVKYLLTKFKFKTIFGTKGEIIYMFLNGIWVAGGRETIETESEIILGDWCKNNLVREIVGKIKRQTAIDLDEFNKIPEGFVCLENCILDLNQNKTFNHSEEYYFKSKIPLIYDKEAECPIIKEFFNQVLYPEDIPLIQEWFGFNLYNLYFEKRAAIFFGPTDTGKTITINLLINFIGEKNKSGLSLQKISNAKGFDVFVLKDKYANIHDDLSAKDLTDNGNFKVATGGSFIEGEQKFGDKIDFKTFAKLTFATNKIPPARDANDEAYYKRWLPIAFDNRCKEKDQNKNLVKELTTKEELSGLLNWAIEGLIRLKKNNGFSFNKSVEDIKNIMQRSSHPLAEFSHDCLAAEDGNKIGKDEMFELYSEWCTRKNISRSTKEQLGKNLPLFMSSIISKRSGSTRYWLNAKIKPNYETSVESQPQTVLPF